MDDFKFERRVSLLTAVFVVGVVVYLVVRNAPFSDPNLVVLMRIILALAVGVLGATIPGFLSVEYNFAGFAIRATGAVGLFLVAFFGTPRVEALHLADTLEMQTEIARHLTNPDNCRTALTESEALLKISPKDPIAHNLNGDAEYCLDNIPAALASFNEAITINADYRPAQYNKAAALIRLGRYADAETMLASLVAADSNYTSARYNLAVAQTALKKYSQAFQNFNFVYGQDKSYDSSFGLGFLYLLNGDTYSAEQSIQHLKISISIKPSLVCILYGKLPFDHDLLEEKPFIDIARLADANPAFRSVRANFDAKFNDAACQDVQQAG